MFSYFLITYLGFTDEAKALCPDSVLNIRYGIAGDRSLGAHTPVAMEPNCVEDGTQSLIFKSALVLQRPVLDPCLAVGFLPLPSSGLRVRQLVNMQWRVERLKDFEEKVLSEKNVSQKFFIFFYLVLLFESQSISHHL